MSGHSKWSTIKRKKAATDAKRGQLFTKLLREIQVAARLSGSGEHSARLKAAIQAAKASSVPNDTIDRAIKRGAGAGEGADFEEVLYEGYGPGGVALMIKALTDNRNRTVGDIRHVLGRFGGSLGASNSVAYLFSDRGMFTLAKTATDEDRLFSLALDAGADDIVDQGDSWLILTDPEKFEAVSQALAGAELEYEGSVKAHPQTSVSVSGDQAPQLLKLLDALDELDDVQNVVANFEIDDAVMAELEGQ